MSDQLLGFLLDEKLIALAIAVYGWLTSNAERGRMYERCDAERSRMVDAINGVREALIAIRERV